jgi:hypothetical protein
LQKWFNKFQGLVTTCHATIVLHMLWYHPTWKPTNIIT